MMLPDDSIRDSLNGEGPMKRSALIALLLGVACTTPPAPPTPRNGMNVQASFGKTWDATVDQFAEYNIQIKTVDRSSGLIVAEEQTVAARQSELADCGKDMGSPLYPTHATWNVLVRGDSTRSTVKATVRFIRQGPARGLLNTDLNAVEVCTSTGKWESDFEATIKEHAEQKP